MNLYKKPVISIISVQTNSILNGFSGDSKVYNCPINPWIACYDYNKCVQEWKNAVEYAVVNKLNRTFLTTSDEMGCPHKDCKIFVKWQRQQKTK